MKAPAVLMIGDCPLESLAGLLVRHVRLELRSGGADVNVVLPDTPPSDPSHAAALSDAVIVVARERNASYSGAIKTLLDSVDTDSVRGKPFGLICYSESPPVTTALEHLSVVVNAMNGVPVPGEVAISLTALALDTAGAGEMSRDAAASISALVTRLLRHAELGVGGGQPPQPGPRLADLALEVGLELAQPVEGKIYEGIARAVAYIKANFSDQNLCLDTVANAVYMSRYHFSRKFREETGRRFIDFLIMLRMTEARKLLIETNWTVTTIAAEAGYRDLSNFERSFKKMFGMQPSQYRLRYARPALDRLHEDRTARTKARKGDSDFRIRALQFLRRQICGPPSLRPRGCRRFSSPTTLRCLAARARLARRSRSWICEDGATSQHQARPAERQCPQGIIPAEGELSAAARAVRASFHSRSRPRVAG
jgi:AraC-like DNA-binding protein/NAD(P)H-dependent FMN reductase